MKVKLHWMLEHMKLSKAYFHKMVREGRIPKPFKLNRTHAEWEKEEILALFPDGWNAKPSDAVDIEWMCTYFNLNRSRLYQLMKAGEIPYQYKSNSKLGFWSESDIRNKYPSGDYNHKKVD